MHDGDYGDNAQRVTRVFTYHEVSKHSLDAYAPGPDTIDWDEQPSPYRHYAGAPCQELPLGAQRHGAGFARLYAPDYDTPCPLTRDSVALLLELSLGLSAWKVMGPDRWALRCNPSSGNLHPSEAYILAGDVPGLEDGLYHYDPETHALETRALGKVSVPGFWLGLTSIQWREAWKYGTRAFRYCALDTGHALGAIRFAAASLGWSVRLLSGLAHGKIEALMGLDRAGEFAGVEPEEGEVLLQILPGRGGGGETPDFAEARWFGRPSRCDPNPPRIWPQITEVTQASRARGDLPPAVSRDALPPGPCIPEPALRSASQTILSRRSARRFTSRTPIAFADFIGLLHAAMPHGRAPWDLMPYEPAAHLLVFVHKVAGLERGLYILPRDAGAVPELRAALKPAFLWVPVPDCGVPFYLLSRENLRPVIRKLSCHQAIAAEGGVSFAMLSQFEAPISQDPWRYRQLHWEAGLIGQSLYLSAHHAGLGASGIGCFFDEEMHQFLGLSGRGYQILYHFAAGFVRDDGVRIEPAYGRASAL